MKSTLKCSLYLLARIVLVCMLSFMSIYLTGISKEVMYPVLAVFYYIMIMYFFVYTMWFEGDKDTNRVTIGLQKYMPYKGFLAAAIAVAPIIILFMIQAFIPSLQGTMFMNVVSIINMIFEMSAFYTVGCVLQIYQADTTKSESFKDVLFNTESITDTQLIAITVSVVLISCVIGAGIGYIVGYKKIHIFKPIADKLTGKKS